MYNIVPPTAGLPRLWFVLGDSWLSGSGSPDLVTVLLPRALGVESGRGPSARG
jgi:hypothetical protein